MKIRKVTKDQILDELIRILNNSSRYTWLGQTKRLENLDNILQTLYNISLEALAKEQGIVLPESIDEVADREAALQEEIEAAEEETKIEVPVPPLDTEYPFLESLCEKLPKASIEDLDEDLDSVYIDLGDEAKDKE